MAKLLTLFLVFLLVVAAVVDAGPQRNSKPKKNSPKSKLKDGVSAGLDNIGIKDYRICILGNVASDVYRLDKMVISSGNENKGCVLIKGVNSNVG